MSRQAWGKGRALLEALGLNRAEIAKCNSMHPLNEEESVQQGLQVWMEGGTNTTWDALLKALETAGIAVQQRNGLKEELCSNTGDSTWTAAVTHACVCVHVHMFASYPVPIFIPNFVCKEIGPGDIGGQSCRLPLCRNSHNFISLLIYFPYWHMAVAQPDEGACAELAMTYSASRLRVPTAYMYLH